MAGQNIKQLGASERVIIVGGGLIGVATLFALSVRNIPATLIEAGPELALETSFANGGMMTPSQAEPWNSPGVMGHVLSSLFDPMAAMKLHWRSVPELMGWGAKFLRNSTKKRYVKASLANFSLSAYSAMQTKEMAKTFAWKYEQSDVGTLKIFHSLGAMHASIQMAEKLAEFGLVYEALNGAAILDKEPQLEKANNNIAGAIYYPNDGVADARLFTLAVAEAAKKLGGEICLNTKMTNWLTNNNHVVGIECSAKDFHGPVVLAAGCMSPKLSSLLGLKLPIAPAKGYSLTLKGDVLGADLPHLPIVDDAMHVAVCPIGTRLRVVGTAEFTGFDLSLSKIRLQNLKHVFSNTYPHLSGRLNWDDAEPWAGLRPMSHDGVPIIGPAPMSGLWLNCGHGHLGWTMAMGAAFLLSQQILGETPTVDPKSYQYRL